MVGDKSCTDTLRIDFSNRDLHSDRSAKMGRAREFLWSHWHDLKCGQLLVTGATKEGVGYESRYKVEVIKPYAAMLSVTISRFRRPNSPPQVISYEVFEMRRIKTRNKYWDKAEPITDNVSLAGSQYLLQFATPEGVYWDGKFSDEF
jgi:hypothetical protein